jgi:hypothetical protein
MGPATQGVAQMPVPTPTKTANPETPDIIAANDPKG